MAHAAELSSLADGLIFSVVGTRGEHTEAKQLHDRTLKGLRNTSHARTNQFDIKAKLDGLVEKFAVLNRDDLSEGLQSRLDELPEKSKWLPEILSLLLELSDRPLEKTRFGDVEDASRTDEEQAALTWADIIADDPLDEADIWDDVERGYHSSDDDFTTDEDASGDETQATSITADDAVTLARMHVLQVEDAALDTVKAAEESTAALATREPVSELTLIREALSMLHGQPTNIYEFDSEEDVRLTHVAKLATASQSVVRHTLECLAVAGASLNLLRGWTKKEQTAHTLRSCQAAAKEEMTQFARQLAVIEDRHLTPRPNSVVSMIDVRAHVEHLARPLLVLASLVDERPGDLGNIPAGILNKMYDQTCIAQLSGDDEVFTLLTGVLSAGLNTYLRRVSRWIATGECDSESDNDFFVIENDPNCSLGRLWHDRFALCHDEKAGTVAPSFLQPFVAGIFALGKGRAFMRALDSDGYGTDDAYNHTSLDLQAHQAGIVPFSQALDDALDAWLAEQSRDHAPLLRTAILRDHGLLATVDAMQDVFFSLDGHRFQTFADTFFWRLDNGARWKDSFLLTELAQSTLGSGEGVVAESIGVQVSAERQNGDLQAKKQSSIQSLQDLRLQYHLPWPLQNVTASPSPAAYSRAFTFLLQTYRAKYLLRQQIFVLRQLSNQPETQHAAPSIAAALKLHQRLATIVDILHAHITHAASLLSIVLKQDLTAAEDIDTMASIWQKHEQVLEISMLIAVKLGPVRKAVQGVLELCEPLMELFGSLSTEEGEGEGTSPETDVIGLLKELDSSLSFITAGLRGIGRAGGNSALERLAERLEWVP